MQLQVTVLDDDGAPVGSKTFNIDWSQEGPARYQNALYWTDLKLMPFHEVRHLEAQETILRNRREALVEAQVEAAKRAAKAAEETPQPD